MKILQNFFGFGGEPPAFIRNFIPVTADSDSDEDEDTDNRPAETADARIALLQLRAELRNDSLGRRKRKRIERKVRLLEGVRTN